MRKVSLQEFISEIQAIEGVQVAVGSPSGSRRNVAPPNEVTSYRDKFAGKLPLPDTKNGGDLVRRVLRCLDDHYTVLIIHPLTKQPWITGRNAYLSTIRRMMAKVEGVA